MTRKAQAKHFLFALICAAITSITESLSILTIQNKATILNTETERGWGEWGEWNSCSRSCGGGVTYMRRQCVSSRLDDANGCVGPSKMYSSCNIQDCPDGSIDFRAEQCSFYNNRVFGGRTFVWEPYVGEAVLNPCELHCKAENSSFINKLSDEVIDGTRCKTNSYDVCVDGTCQEVGCDMMLGSKLREDKCMECGGDGTSCFRVNGVFRATNLPTGYVDVVTIPAGATNIEVVDYRTPQNFLAVRYLSENYLLNGNRRIESSGALQVAGTTFHYRRRLDRRREPESLRALGPTTEDTLIQLFVQERNRGVRYRFYLPRDAKDTNGVGVEWISSEWSKCSHMCGGGIQHRRITCMKDNSTAAPYLCHALQRPVARQRCNAEACVARWQTSNWTECSATCNGGVRFRQVYCAETAVSLQSSVLRIVRDERCVRQDSTRRPPHREACNEIPCSGWSVGNWSTCSTSCDVGQQFRSVSCPPGKECLSSPPQRARRCNVGPCSGISWVVTAWSQCTVSCEEGMQSRLVRCASDDGATYDDELCHGTPRPVAIQSCQSTNQCLETLEWMTGKWSKCSAECGDGMQTRKVSCSILDHNGHRMLPDERCKVVGSKPVVMRHCKVPKCEAVWFTGPWRACSRTCGGGMRTRLVMCVSELDPDQTAICVEANKPAAEEACNSGPCLIPRNPTPFLTIDSKPNSTEDCALTLYGCCPDRHTAAQGWLLEGCPGVELDESPGQSCYASTYGCCDDGVQVAEGLNHEGCSEYDSCYVPSDRGEFCGDWLPRYYFDPNDSNCKHFWFGGCGGNDNNYLDEEKCLAQCEKSNSNNVITSSTIGVIDTSTNSRGNFASSTTTTASRVQSTTSRKPIANTISTRSTTSSSVATSSSTSTASTSIPTTTAVSVEREVFARTILLPAVADNASTLWVGPRARILSVHDCSLSPDSGPCFGRLHRWYFDAVDHTCKTFIFSGCAANPNNFETQEECMTACYREEHVNVEHDRDLTKCEQDQTLADFEEKRPPQCDSISGKYRPLQCISDINGVTISCWCVDSENGVEIDGSRRYGSIAPDCSSSTQPPNQSPSTSCTRSRYGCCPDGVTRALGYGKRGCSVSLRIKPGPSVVYTRPGGSASIPCEAVGYPKPRVKWYKDGEELLAINQESRVLRNGYNLIFVSVQPRHLGTYVCEVSNGVNLKQRKTVRLIINEARLRFRTQPSNISVGAGESTHFKCRIRSDRALVSWLKDGLPLNSTKRIIIRPWGDLRIDRTQSSDQGLYTCVAKSSSGTISSSASLLFLENSSHSTNGYIRPFIRTLTTTSTNLKQEKCEDNPELANCRLVAAAGMCKKVQYRNICCKTCLKFSSITNNNYSNSEDLS